MTPSVLAVKSSVFLAKDFVTTAEGLAFAVLVGANNPDQVISFLRYARSHNRWQKLSSQPAQCLLQTKYPDYLYFCPSRQAHLHAVPKTAITCHLQPRQRLQELLATGPSCPAEQDLIAACQMLGKNGLDLANVGVTGSILLGAAVASSDIDLVFYAGKDFHAARQIIRQLLASKQLAPMQDQDWYNAYQRRGCALTWREYVWHEKRKFNKFTLNGRQVDLSLTATATASTPQQKLATVTITTNITDASLAFAYPAIYAIDHPQIRRIVSWTATYNGQAQNGEKVQASGWLEDNCGEQQLLVGSNREATGEYIKVVHKGVGVN